MRNSKKKFNTLCSAPWCVAFVWNKRRPWTTYFCTVSLLGKLGTLCLESVIWSFVFLVRLIVGWLKGSTLEVTARKETSYGDVLPGPFCGKFWKKGIVELHVLLGCSLLLYEYTRFLSKKKKRGRKIGTMIDYISGLSSAVSSSGNDHPIFNNHTAECQE